jgi:hypothetical protein
MMSVATIEQARAFALRPAVIERRERNVKAASEGMSTGLSRKNSTGNGSVVSLK